MRNAMDLVSYDNKKFDRKRLLEGRLIFCRKDVEETDSFDSMEGIKALYTMTLLIVNSLLIKP